MSCSAAHAPIASTVAALTWASSIAASTPKSATSSGSSSHQAVTNPPLRPLAPLPQIACSISTTRADGSCSVTKNAVHSPV